jgi:hypothetical protein
MKILYTLLLFVPLAAAQNAEPARPAARSDVYHVHFAKAAPGKAARLGDFYKSQGSSAAMPGHQVVLRHHLGDTWDYLVIEHLGTKATVEPGGTPVPAGVRDLIDWHNDTFVSGPPWADFARALGLADAAKTGDSVYVVAVYRATAGHREALEKSLVEAEAPSSGDKAAGYVLLQHLEGGPWNYLEVGRYNTWEDLAANEAASSARTRKGSGDWYALREHEASHTDTLADRVAP